MKNLSLLKKMFTALSALIVATAFTSCGKAADESGSGANPITIRVGYFGTSQYQTQLAVAKEKGYFDEVFEGMDVNIEYNFFAGAGPAINEALLAGDIDIAYGVGDQPTLSGISNGNGNVIVSRVVKNARGTGIIVGSDLGISSVAELKNRKIAVAVGTANQKTLDLLLADAGLTEADVEIVNLSSIDDQLAAISSREIDAAFTANLAYGLNKAEQNNTASLLTDCTSHPNYAYLSINRNFADENHDAVQKFINALYKADRWYAENKEEGIQIVADFLGIDVETARIGNESSDIEMAFNDEDIENLKITYEFMENNDILPNKIDDLSSIIDDSFIKEAISNQ